MYVTLHVCLSAPMKSFIESGIRLSFAAIVGACVLPPALGQDLSKRTGPGLGARYTAAELRARLQSTNAALSSVEVQYRASGYGPEFPPGTYLYREFAAAAPYYLDHLSAHGHDELAWTDDFLQQRTKVTENKWFTERPLCRTFSSGALKPTDALPGTMSWEIYFLATGFWPLQRPAPKPKDIRWTFRDLAGSSEHSYVRPSLEDVRGRHCHVLEWPGRDRLWLDADRSCCIMAREICDPLTGDVRRRLDLGGHAQHGVNLWLPTWIQTEDFENRRSVARSQISIVSTTVNAVDLRRFEFTPMPGSLRMTPGQRPELIAEGGLDQLQIVAVKVEHLIQEGHNRSAWPSLGSLLWLMVVPLILLSELRRSHPYLAIVGKLRGVPWPAVARFPIPVSRGAAACEDVSPGLRKPHLISGLSLTLQSRGSRLLVVFTVCAAFAAYMLVPMKNKSTEHFLAGIGTFHRPIGTRSLFAQRYFDQGLALLFGFETEQALKSFKAAVVNDPNCAMAHWGVAMANGPNINDMAMSWPSAEAAWRSVNMARQLAVNATPVERALIDATCKRYARPELGSRQNQDEAYAAAMSRVAQDYPADGDVGALAAEALLDLRPWNQWTHDGMPQPGTEKVIQLLEHVLDRSPEHPFALHLLIHALEGSPHPERAQSAARRLETLAPSLQHLVHMPSHIYARTGQWEEAIESNRRAIEAERDLQRQIANAEDRVSMAHNLHMLSYAAMMGGQSALADESVHRMLANIPDKAIQPAPGQFDGLFAMPYEANVRFGEWDLILAEPSPKSSFPVTTALWHFARGIAFAAKHNPSGAKAEQTAFIAARKLVPPSTTVLQCPASKMFDVADSMLTGEIAYRLGDTDQACNALRQAVKYEDALPYAEPPTWVMPTRHALGATLMDTGRYAEAETVYREDLARNLENGWSLNGLYRSLKMQGKTAEAEGVLQRFKKAWQFADVKISSSCCCLPDRAGGAQPPSK